MIRSKTDVSQPTARNLTPASKEAVAQFDEILRETAGMWDNEDGAHIAGVIEEIFESPASKVAPSGLR